MFLGIRWSPLEYAGHYGEALAVEAVEGSVSITLLTVVFADRIHKLRNLETCS